jgi:hypothetical protein
MIMTKLRQVFIPGGQPHITYVTRSRFSLERQLKDYLDTGHSLFSITGPTKTGKTVLCRSVVSKEEAIWLSGGEIGRDDDIWTSILDELERFTEISEENTAISAKETSSEIGAEASIPFIKGGGKLSDRHSTGKIRGNVRTRTRPLTRTAIEALVDSNKILIIDDFHYLERGTQTKLVRALKQPIFDGARVIVLAVPHRAYDVVRVEKEMTGRVGHLAIQPWTPDELREIPDRGFDALNIKDDGILANRFVEEAFASPHLMQTFCQRICLHNDIRETCSVTTSIAVDNERSFFGEIARESSKPAFDRLATGPRQRSDRLTRQFADGAMGDIYIAVLRAIARTGPRTSLTYEDIRAKLREMLAGEIPQAHEISRVLTKMTEIAKEKIEGEPVLEWDEDSKMLHIADPFFAFYLRWGELVRPGTSAGLGFA